MRFAIITPTIGRDTLLRCLITMRRLVLNGIDYTQIVVGDGPQEQWVAEECMRDKHIYYIETPTKEGFYGTSPRNHALELIESDKLGQFDYVLFVDDDNILLEPTLYNLAATIETNNHPPLIWHEILFTNKYQTQYFVLPKGHEPLKEGDWDSLNGVYRTDVIKGLRWKPIYNHDYHFAKEATDKAGAGWVRCDGIAGVHCLSWDTYELVRNEGI
jgi:glycosyltransferase involved in cell wall biosynthesis